MAAVLRNIALPETVRSSPTAEILRFPGRRAPIAVAADPCETYGQDHASPFSREVAAGWAVALVLAALVVVLF